MNMRNTTVLTGVTVFSFCATLSLAQDTAESKKKSTAEQLTTGTTPAATTIDRIIEQAVRNISARYALNDVQSEETLKLMRTGVRSFLREHENEVWPVIQNLLRNKLTAPESDEDMKRIGKMALPLVEEAKKAIFDANERWRLLLTDEQKKTHDFDMAEMEETFAKVDENFRKWGQGIRTAGGVVPPINTDNDPQPPTQPRPGEIPRIERSDPKALFEKLVEAFIKEYQLDEGQITSARSILEEFKNKADDFTTSKKAELAALAAKQNAARRDMNVQRSKQLSAEQKKLLGPIFALVTEMTGRLKGLLTTSQIQRHADADKATKPASKVSTVSDKSPAKKKAGTSDESTSTDSRPSDGGNRSSGQ